MRLSATRERAYLEHTLATARQQLAARERAGWPEVGLAAQRAAIARYEARLAALPPPRRGRQFSSGRVEVIVCASCGKRTTSGVDDTNLELCRPCYARISYENQHSDGGHDGEMEACPVCAPAYRRLLKGRA
jgi:hypothetical protein